MVDSIFKRSGAGLLTDGGGGRHKGVFINEAWVVRHCLSRFCGGGGGGTVMVLVGRRGENGSSHGGRFLQLGTNQDKWRCKEGQSGHYLDRQLISKQPFNFWKSIFHKA